VRSKVNPLTFLLFFALACNFLLPPRATLTPSPTASPQPLATNNQPPATSPPPTPNPQSLAPSVLFHPDPQLYSGDIVSLEVDEENVDPAWQDASVKLYLGAAALKPLAVTKFERRGIGRQLQATFTWAWDTGDLVGPQTLIVNVVPPEAEALSLAPLAVLTLTANLLPAAQRPMPEPLAHWAESESECCLFHYLTGTAAARDIAQIESEADTALAHTEARLGVKQKDKITVTLLSRLLGHGGFATEGIALSYIDRNPVGSTLFNIFAHEGSHVLDQQLSPTRPTIMTEGLAVYTAGGHFKTEPLDQRAAALLALKRYLPLSQLVKDFYPAQHEISYLEAGAFITYLVDTYGWESFKKFYSSFRPGSLETEMLNSALRANFGKNLTELEADWLAHLRSVEVSSQAIEDLRLSIELYDTLRRYQTVNDPAAHFLNAWLPDVKEARRRGIVADFVRHPNTPESIALETMLVEAARALEAGDFARTEKLLTSVNAVLEAHNLFSDPLAAAYLGVVTDLASTGYEAQTITFQGRTATVTAIRDWPTLETITLTRPAPISTDSLLGFYDGIIWKEGSGG